MSLKHIEVSGKEIALVNAGGRFFAIGDRCGHMNASLSRGRVVNSTQGKMTVVCPLHGSTFDPATGKLISGPVKPPPPSPGSTPKPVPEELARAAELSALIKVLDVESFEVKLDGDDIKLHVAPLSR